MNVDRDTFYDPEKIAIVPMGFCFPGLDSKGGDLPPRRECREQWHDRIMQELPQIQLLLVIGQYAHAYHLGKRRQKTLTGTVADWRRIRDQSDGRRIYALAATVLAQQCVAKEESLVRNRPAA